MNGVRCYGYFVIVSLSFFSWTSSLVMPSSVWPFLPIYLYISIVGYTTRSIDSCNS
jgi:hypothetical protein